MFLAPSNLDRNKANAQVFRMAFHSTLAAQKIPVAWGCFGMSLGTVSNALTYEAFHANARNTAQLPTTPARAGQRRR